MKILVLDNYDSFTYNLVHAVKKLGFTDVEVHRNDQIALEDIARFDKIILSPGPGVPSESGILLDVVAPSQAMADSICSLARSTLLHYGYIGRIATAGNLAFPFSPSDIRAGLVYEFSIYHLMEYTPEHAFKFELENVTAEGVMA